MRKTLGRVWAWLDLDRRDASLFLGLVLLFVGVWLRFGVGWALIIAGVDVSALGWWSLVGKPRAISARALRAA